MKRGRLIAFEGLDGSGKTTQLALLVATLRAAGCDVVATCEPTDGPHGQRIRAMARSGETVSAQQELRWFVEDRREHAEQVLRPALAAGRVVITDRYFLSTVAYQGARGLDPGEILASSEAEFPLPDLAVLLEIDPAAGLERVAARGAALEGAFERRARLEGVAEIFHSLDRPYVERVDARPAPEEVAREVAARVRDRLDLP